jgi:hypothetical protein
MSCLFLPIYTLYDWFLIVLFMLFDDGAFALLFGRTPNCFSVICLCQLVPSGALAEGLLPLSPRVIRALLADPTTTSLIRCCVSSVAAHCLRDYMRG